MKTAAAWVLLAINVIFAIVNTLMFAVGESWTSLGFGIFSACAAALMVVVIKRKRGGAHG